MITLYVPASHILCRITHSGLGFSGTGDGPLSSEFYAPTDVVVFGNYLYGEPPAAALCVGPAAGRAAC